MLRYPPPKIMPERTTKNLTVVWETSLRDLKANPHGADSGWLVITSFPAELVSINLVHFHSFLTFRGTQIGNCGSVLLIKGGLSRLIIGILVLNLNQKSGYQARRLCTGTANMVSASRLHSPMNQNQAQAGATAQTA